MEEARASQSTEPSSPEIELKQLVILNRDEISGKNKMEVNEALFEELIGESDNHFLSLVVVGSSSRKNTKLLGKLIKCLNTHENALQNYKFDEDRCPVHRRGVWICSKPLMVNLNSKIINFLLLEVQCTRDEYTEAFEVHNIFELGLIMSSVMILNFTERIDENILRWFGKSYKFVQNLVSFPARKWYTDFSEQMTRGLNASDIFISGYPLVCSKFQSVVFLIGDYGSNLKTRWRRPELTKRQSKTDDVRKFLCEKYDLMTRSSKRSRDIIFENFDDIICSFSAVNNTDNTISDVSFIFDNDEIENNTKLLCGAPLQVKFFKKLFISTVSLMNDDCSEVSRYQALRTSLFQMCASNFTVFAGQLIKREFETFLLEKGAFNDRVFEEKQRLFQLGSYQCVKNFDMYFEKHTRSFWCSSEIRSMKFQPDVCVCDLEETRSEIWTTIELLRESHVKNFSIKKEIFLRGIIDDSKKSADLEIRKCIEKWDNTKFKSSEQIDQILSNLQASVMKQTQSKHPKVTFENKEMLDYIAQKKSELIKHNETVFKCISQDFQQSFMVVVGSLVDKLIEAINNSSCDSRKDFQILCAEQKQIHEEHFKRNEVEKLCDNVVSQELPKIESIFSKVLDTMTSIYVCRCVNNTFVNRSDVYSKLGIDIPLQDNNVSISFGTADVKHEVFPKLQIDIMLIMSDTTINTLIILELVELGVFDTLEMERPLHGKFDLEKDRVLSLMRVIQNRNSDEIQMCLEKLCNLRSSMLKRKQFRDAFGLVFPDCIINDAPNQHLNIAGPPLPYRRNLQCMEAGQICTDGVNCMSFGMDALQARGTLGRRLSRLIHTTLQPREVWHFLNQNTITEVILKYVHKSIYSSHFSYLGALWCPCSGCSSVLPAPLLPTMSCTQSFWFIFVLFFIGTLVAIVSFSAEVEKPMWTI